MKSRPYLKNLARYGLLLLNLFVLSSFILGCDLSTKPTYIKEDIEKSIQDICKNEYKIDIKVRLVGSTLWIYMPVEDILTKAEKPEKYLERFAIEENIAEYRYGMLKLDYTIKKMQDTEKIQEYEFNKKVLEKINNVWKALRRVIFSMEHSEENEPKFLYLITADIKNGFEIKELSYYQDLKKVSYEFISWTEYQHRVIQDLNIAPEIIDDKEGTHLDYRDITLGEFVASQIQHRIKLKFQKPEVDKNVDIDKEIIKIIVYTIKIYGLKDFLAVELHNLLTQNKIILNQAAVWARPME